MVEKYRIHEVAKDLGRPSKEIVELLTEYFGGEPKKHMAALESNELSLIFEHYTRKHGVENFDAYFAQAAEKKPKPEPKPEKEVTRVVAAPVLEATPAPVASAAPPPMPQSRPQPKPTGQNPAQRQGQNQGQRPGQNQGQRPGQNQGQRPGQNQGQRPGQNQSQRQGQNYRPQQQPPLQGSVQVQTNQTPAAPQADRHVDMRTVKVNLDKYNERYETIAPTNLAKKDTGVRKQKLNQKSAQRGRPFMSRKDKDIARIKRLEMERQRRQKLDITLPEQISVGDLALRLKVQSSEVVKRLMNIGVMASVSDVIDYDTAAMVAMEIGAKVSPEVVVTIEERLFDVTEDKDDALEERSPIVVVMGHVDHGKTSILDYIRNTRVTEGEAGGITQHIGAYQVETNGKKVTFLDTPGHAAFTSMRARGANVTDIAILVVAADDGIMPQTVEAIDHAKAAGVSIIIAINKMDKPTANPDRIKQELTEHGLVIEDWGGDTICCEVSAKTGQGMDNLLEMVQLAAEVKELKANPEKMAKGTVIEARLDKGRGPIATILVQNGTLRLGDVIIAGTALGRVRVMQDDRGERIEEAGPSTPVEISGLGEVPQAGDIFNAVEDERLARELVDKRRFDAKEEVFKQYSKVTLDNLFDQISEGEIKELPIIVKADVQGSVEAVKQSLEKIANEEVRVRVIHGGVGAVSESDVMLANASGAIIVGFNVRPDPVAKEVADRDGVDIRLYRIIYDAIDEISDAMKGMLAPKTREVELGRAEVRQVYKISSIGTIAGCHVLSGKITRTAQIRVVRDGIIVADDVLDSLKRFKDDVKEVASGYECGIGLTKFNDIREGDIFEAYEIEEYRD